MSPAELSIIVFLQLLVIVAAARALGWLVRTLFGQPQVVGEMIAGVLLGPSLFGLIAPDLQAMLFPPESRPMLYVVAQIGIGLYMFLVGLSFNRAHFRANIGSAGAVSISGMAVPFLAAIVMTPWLMSQGLMSPRLDTLQATLFIGACISITAFPMLARIIEERGIARAPLGSLTLAAGAIGDAGAWMVLAIVLATFGAGTAVALKAILGAAIFAVLVLGLGPRLFAPSGAAAARAGGVGQGLLAIVIMLVMAACFAMDWAGMHAVLGGFLLGIAMPRGVLGREIKAKLEPITTVLLVPIFFTFSGLSTQLTIVGDPALLLVALAILAVSILSKFGACWAAARLTGQDNPTALGIGALMNARGMMELIIINIGLQAGVIGPALFSMLVLMAIVTTLMASPLFELLVGGANVVREEAPEELPTEVTV